MNDDRDLSTRHVDIVVAYLGLPMDNTSEAEETVVLRNVESIQSRATVARAHS